MTVSLRWPQVTVYSAPLASSEEEKRIEVKSYFAVTVASSPNCTSFPALPLNLYET